MRKRCRDQSYDWLLTNHYSQYVGVGIGTFALLERAERLEWKRGWPHTQYKRLSSFFESYVCRRALWMVVMVGYGNNGNNSMKKKVNQRELNYYYYNNNNILTTVGAKLDH